MQVSALIRIRRPRRATSLMSLRTLLRAAARLRTRRGFQRWQTFRAMDASDTIMIVTDWASMDAFRHAALDEDFGRLAALASTLGLIVETPLVLPHSFDRRLSHEESVSTLLRVSASTRPASVSAARDSDLALQALAAPGSTRLSGARCAESSQALCRIDFDSEDGVWHFLESPLRRTWTQRAELDGEDEVWALNLPRFQYESLLTDAATERPRRIDTLNVSLDVDDAGHTARLRLHGTVDHHGSTQCEKLCQVLIRDGCQRLVVDVSELRSISPQALNMLARTARELKLRGGTFTLIDNADRVKRITRSKHLEQSVRCGR